MEFIFNIAIIFIGFFFGWYARELVAKKIVKSYVQTLAEEHNNELANTIHIKIEKVDTNYYVYNSDTEVYMFQVKSKDELMNVLNKDYADKTIMMKSNYMKLFEV